MENRTSSASKPRRTFSKTASKPTFAKGSGGSRSFGARKPGGNKPGGFSRGGFKGGRSGGGRSSGGNRRGGGGGGGRRGARKMASFDPSQFINKNPVELKEEVYVAKNPFASLAINDLLKKTIASMGIINPSPIQDQTIPASLEGRDVIGLAETGTGKTAAFLIPMIERTIQSPNNKTLILAPTRELAIQIQEEFRKLSRNQKLFSVVCVGGMPIHPQIRQLRRQQHFIIGTPGRVLDLIRRGNLKTTDITGVVLDEADRMLDMGFIHDMRAILSDVPKDRQTLLFSATMTKQADGLVNDFLTDPISVSVKKKDVTNSIGQDVVRFKPADKYETLLDLLKQPEFTRVIVFGAMKHSVEKLARGLTADRIRSESIHGNKSHSQRQRALRNFKEGKALVLVATDVAARGIHVDDVSHVINYDMPGTFEDYVHRIGRTGRGNKRGQALTFVPAAGRSHS